MRNRIVLIGLTVLIWVALKAIDSYVTGPEILFILSIAACMMAGHSIWLLSAQSRHRAKTQKRGQAIKSLEAVTAKGSQDYHPSVDILISAKNESRVIETTVRNLFKIDYDDYKVWVVDDMSTDSMPDILKRLQGEFPDLQVLIREPGSCPGKSAALNEALALCKGDVMAVFDADASVAPDFLTKILPCLAPENVGAVQAQKRMYEYQKGFLVDCQDTEYALDSYFQVSRDLIGGAVELRGNGQLVKRQALVDVGGWNNKAITDDLDLSMRLLVNNWDITFSPDTVVWEEAVPTLKGLLRQRRRWAEGSIRRYLDYIFPLNSPTRLSLVERLDTLVFTVYFVVPALMLLEAAPKSSIWLLVLLLMEYSWLWSLSAYLASARSTSLSPYAFTGHQSRCSKQPSVVSSSRCISTLTGCLLSLSPSPKSYLASRFRHGTVLSMPEWPTMLSLRE
ncbi:MAG: glycosyltransferase family 2 protein [Candidatus Obscuribacter sp.]|nr:glycosyltransferase family 2 protein [Candidatus Obscuribacter sp.]